MLGMRVLSASTVTTRYFHTDNLGSIAVITDETGAVVERDGYDAWGKRRFPNGADDPTGSLTSQTTRGFTGQEELSDVGLVHLNGRVYDPLIARMMSADPVVPDPMNGQAWNRYSYVINNPLAFTDPSGYCFLGLCGLGNDISSFFNNIFKQIGRVLRGTPILGSIVTIAAAALCAPVGPVCAVAAAFLTTTAVAGMASGNIGAGLKAGLIAAATAVAFYEVGNLTNAIAGVDPNQAHIQPQFGTAAYDFNVVAHAAVGCGAAVASGQQCGPGALAGGVTSAAGPVINGHGFVFGLVANSALGGGAAVLGGGKFENGAITGAFGYLFNSEGGGKALSMMIGRTIPGLGFVLDMLFAPPAGSNSSLDKLLDKLDWGNLNTLQDHFDCHGSDFGATDPIDYAVKARDWFAELSGAYQQRLIQPTGLSECMIRTPTSSDHTMRTELQRRSINLTLLSTGSQQTGIIGLA
jgi:RHS repeat-associated protein